MSDEELEMTDDVLNRILKDMEDVPFKESTADAFVEKSDGTSMVLDQTEESTHHLKEDTIKEEMNQEEEKSEESEEQEKSEEESEESEEQEKSEEEEEEVNPQIMYIQTIVVKENDLNIPLPITIVAGIFILLNIMRLILMLCPATGCQYGNGVCFPKRL